MGQLIEGFDVMRICITDRSPARIHPKGADCGETCPFRETDRQRFGYRTGTLGLVSQFRWWGA